MDSRANIVQPDQNLFSNQPPKVRPRNRKERVALQAAERARAMASAARKQPPHEDSCPTRKRQMSASYAGACG